VLSKMKSGAHRLACTKEPVPPGVGCTEGNEGDDMVAATLGHWRDPESEDVPRLDFAGVGPVLVDTSEVTRRLGGCECLAAGEGAEFRLAAERRGMGYDDYDPGTVVPAAGKTSENVVMVNGGGLLYAGVALRHAS